MDHDPDALRPLWHYTPPANWMNDPNGLVYVDGTYHLFFQHNPYGLLWGHMSWGHAVSHDLLHWETLDVALTPYEAREPSAVTMIFSGSAVPLPDGMLRAYYTAHERIGDTAINEAVAVADSTDGGRTWVRHADNPVLDTGRRDFRDPKVFWHAPSESWVMAVAAAAEHRIEFYRSDEGLSWGRVGEFETPRGSRRVWECPDLVELEVRDAAGASFGTRWVLFLSAGHPAGDDFSGMAYWVGDFDGRTFVSDHDDVRWLDHGKDFYAGVTFNGLPAGVDPVMIGWMSNWTYVNSTPATTWRGTMSLPRSLHLVVRDGEHRVAQRPVGQYDALLADELQEGDRARALDIRCRVGTGSDGPAVLRLESGDREVVEIVVDPLAGTITLDRSRSGDVDFHPSFASVEVAPLRPGTSTLDVQIVADHGTIEVFCDEGTTVLSELVRPSGPWAVVVRGPVSDLCVRGLGRSEGDDARRLVEAGATAETT